MASYSIEIKKSASKEIDKLPYRYGAHKLPWDAEHHELSTGRTRTKFLRECGLENIEIFVTMVNRL